MIETTVDPLALRRTLGRFATGVVVVTTQTDEGQPVGMTMNSFTSVSLDPPLVLYSVSRSSRLHRPLVEAPGFAINVLTEAQKDLSLRFAKPGFDRFGALAYTQGQMGAPVLPDALAVIECETRFVTEAGDHDLVLGRVIALTTDPEIPCEPLVFFSGAYRRLDNQYTDW